MMLVNNSTKMIISSCDAYKDLWAIHVDLLNKYWKNRFFDTCIVTDKSVNAHFENVDILSAGEDLEMPMRLKAALDSCDCKYIILTLDDYLLNKQIDSNRIQCLIDLMKKNNVSYLRLFPIPRETKCFNKSLQLYHINLSRNYAVNLYPGIWEKSFLYSTIVKSMNAWDYEVSLTKIALDNDIKCLASMANDYPFVDTIRKGKLLHKAARFLKKNGYTLDRELVPKKEEFKLWLMKTVKAVLPMRLQRAIKKMLVKMGFKFISKDV